MTQLTSFQLKPPNLILLKQLQPAFKKMSNDNTDRR